jgi:hypothetical protein
MSDPAAGSTFPIVSARTPADNEALAAEMAALAGMTAADLRAEWRRLYRAHPPKKLSRDLLELAVAWKLQERALGDLSAITKRQLAELAQTMEAKSDLAKARKVSLKPGARLLRAWGRNVLLRGFRSGFGEFCHPVVLHIRPRLIAAACTT